VSRRGNGEGSIYKREQRHTRKDGSVVTRTVWCAAISLDFGQRKMLYGNTRQEVADKLKATTGKTPAGVQIKTAQYLEQWLADTVKPGRKPLTYVRYANVVHKHLVPALGRLPLGKLGPEHVQRLQANLRHTGLSPASVLGVRNTLSAALSQAERWQLIPRNPVQLVEPPQIEDKEPRVLSREEAERFLRAARGDAMEYLFALMLATGLRPGEARGLAWSAVQLSGPVPALEVRQQSIELGRALAGPKSRHGRRWVPLVPLGVWALQAQRQRPLRGFVNDLVFPSADGRPLASRTVREHFLAIIKRAGIQAATPHTLRHSAATYLLGVGVADRVVQEILGHGSAAMTRHYQHVTPELLADAGTRLAAYFATFVATQFATQRGENG
jgi:integrase